MKELDFRDRQHMARALVLARDAIALSEPNPRVGCVLAAQSGDIVAEGHTQEAGGPHAEVVALRAAARTGASVAGGTAYVTLEPCAHHGRTPPCADALVHARIRRVVVALLDPNPLVCGQGVAKMLQAGIEVHVMDPKDRLAMDARELNIGFLSRMVRRRPWVRVKVAVSLDGRSALLNGQSQWITGLAAREDGHVWRARASAVMTGMGTVRDDDPKLSVRAIDVARQPRKVVLDPRWSLPLDAALLAQAPEDVIVFGLDGVEDARRAVLAAKGVQTVTVPRDGSMGGAKLDLATVLSELAGRGVNELHVEAGARLTGAVVSGGWADELLVYLAPKILGPGRPLAELPGLSSLEHVALFEWLDVAKVGDDVRLRVRRVGADAF